MKAFNTIPASEISDIQMPRMISDVAKIAYESKDTRSTLKEAIGGQDGRTDRFGGAMEFGHFCSGADCMFMKVLCLVGLWRMRLVCYQHPSTSQVHDRWVVYYAGDLFTTLPHRFASRNYLPAIDHNLQI